MQIEVRLVGKIFSIASVTVMIIMNVMGFIGNTTPIHKPLLDSDHVMMYAKYSYVHVLVIKILYCF